MVAHPGLVFSHFFVKYEIDMIEHWYDYLPAAWFIPEGRWYVLLSVLLLMVISNLNKLKK